MSTPGFRSFDLTVALSYGSIPGFDARVALAILARGVMLDGPLVDAFASAGDVRGRVAVLWDARDDPRRVEAALDAAATRRLLEHAAATFSRPLRIDGVPDTSDTYVQVVAQGAIDDQPFRVAFGAMCSGYRGPDAAAFAGFMRELLSVAGVTGDGPWRDLLLARSGH
jgi:hypothetical protein